LVGVTGANGYVGGRVLDHLRTQGIDAVAMVRRPQQGARERRYALAEPLEDSFLEDIDAVVHAAYDASQVGASVRTVNVLGSTPLLDAVAARGGRVLLISSLSAFEGTRTLYGAAKLELERAVLARGGLAIRPGLVFGARPGGLFGAMSAALSRTPLVPLPGGGWQRQFVTHDRALAELLAATISQGLSASGPVFAAHEAPTTLRDIAAQIATAHGRRLRVLTLAARPTYLGMRAAELARVPLPFRSDSMLSLLNPIPLDQVAELERLPLDFPALTPELWAG
jgi:nucleoside-diphosphate-sugar epimerase